MINFQSITPSFPEGYKSSCIFASNFKESLPIGQFDSLSDMRSAFGQRLFDARKHAGLTQVQLSERVATSQANIGELERKGNSSGLTPAIAKLCGVNVEWLAYGEGEMIGANTQPAPVSQEVFSEEVRMLAKLLNEVPPKKRMKAFGAAASAIVRVTQQTSPKPRPLQPDSARKTAAKSRSQEVAHKTEQKPTLDRA